MDTNWKKEWKWLAIIAAVFTVCWFLPVGNARFENSLWEAFHLVKWYAREHVLLCLIPAFFIAGAISVFVSQQSVMKYLGANAPKFLAYSVASISGCVLAVCSCTILPLFAGIYRMGAGLGPAITFLYAGPAVNVLAILLTARVLGMEMGIARAVGAIGFSIVIGIMMHFVFRNEEKDKIEAMADIPAPEASRPLWKNGLVLFTMIGVLIFANWSITGKLRVGLTCCPGGDEILYYEGEIVNETDTTITIRDKNDRETVIEKLLLTEIHTLEQGRAYETIFSVRYEITIILILLLTAMLIGWFPRGELGEWGWSSWGFAKQIMPLLLAGVFVAGLLFGRPGHDALIPSGWVEWALGGNSLRANFFASVAGALMYFATLTEIPIIQGLMGSGMGKGPALALLLAGPALSLPNMLVIRSVIGGRKTVVFVVLVVITATLSGLVYGICFPE